MLNTLTTRPADVDYSDMLPPWLRYLVAAYPAARLAAHTFAVFEDAFGGHEPAVMMAAAKAAVAAHRFFPSVAELMPHVRRAAEAAELDAARALTIAEYRQASAAWPACPDCGEQRNPTWPTCPACADLARMEAL